MANGIRRDDPHGLNIGCSSKFREGSRVRQTPEEGRRTYRPKRFGNNHKDEDNSPKTLKDKNHQASYQKFRQLTINIIMNYINHHPKLSPLKINCNTLRKILLFFTTEVLSYDPHGYKIIQNDGIAMGSVLGLIFSYFYMSALENKIFNTINKPNIYLRYADDIHLLTNCTDEINTIQETFQNNGEKNHYNITQN